MNIYSNTLIRDGEPFTKLIFRQVLPFVKKAFVTISEKSTDSTMQSLEELKKEFPRKMVIDTENVSKPYLLTQERQKQLDKVPKGKWVLFLDGDDLWPTEQLKMAEMFMTKDVDGLSINPFQIVDREHYDKNWENKYFLKLFRNDPGVHYEHPWPRDMIYKNQDLMYWKKNSKCPRVGLKFFHLSNLMKWKFRDLPKFKEDYKYPDAKPVRFDPGWEEDIEKIYECLR